MGEIDDSAYHLQLGSTGETIAVDYLRARGHRVLHTNWRHGHKELDIVCIRGDTLVVVEVKSRTGTPWEDPDQAVGRRKQRNTIEAADAYVHRYNHDLPVQFDVVCITFHRDDTYSIEHIPDAFYPTL